MRSSPRWCVLGWLLVAACGGGQDEPSSEPACRPPDRFDATGYFQIDEACGRNWLVDPQGNRFYSTGVNHVNYGGDFSPASNTNPYADAAEARYGAEDAWAAATSARLGQWGWNTVGAWSSHGSLGPRMPYTVMLGLSQGDWQSGAIPDYFAEEWEQGVADAASRGIAGRESDPNLLGYFIDNELHWGPDWRIGHDLFDDYLLLDPDAPGKRALIALMVERHASIDSFNDAWGTSFASFDELASATSLPFKDLSDGAASDRRAFVAAVSDRFFSVTSDAIRARDPNHLVLGARFVAMLTPIAVVASAARYVDIVSVNAYELSSDPTIVFDPTTFEFVDLEGEDWLAPYHELTGKPVLVSEFGFRAADAEPPNTWPPIYPTLATQQERADRFEAYARRCFDAPWIVGFHWFEYADQPAEGRFDGEDNNWGLVDVRDDPYEAVVARTTRVNRMPYEACFPDCE